MIDLDVIQVIVQGGAVGLLLAFGYFGYKIANRLITVAVGLLSNHLTHIEQALLKLTEAVDRLYRRGD
jgi:hypothetical protein